jgi:hypothetical protein
VAWKSASELAAYDGVLPVARVGMICEKEHILFASEKDPKPTIQFEVEPVVLNGLVWERTRPKPDGDIELHLSVRPSSRKVL